MKYLLCLSFLLLSSVNAYAEQVHHPAIHSVVKAFGKAIEDKDKTAFLALFLDEKAPMQMVFTEKSMKIRRAMVEKYNKEQNKNMVATRVLAMSPVEMMDNVVAKSNSPKEEFINLRVHSDGSIAAVYFDYVFYIDGKKNNWGEESWLMVQTLDGWKIQSIVYSIDSD